jgi:hypothetical protein
VDPRDAGAGGLMPVGDVPLTPIIDTVTGSVTEIGRIFLRTLSTAVGALAPIDAAYWTSKATAVLTSEVNLGALASGYLKLATAVGVAPPTTVPTAALAGKATLPIAETDVTNLVADLAAKAPLASPGLTGVPTAPTAAPGTSSTQLATTAFVAAAAGSSAAGSTRCACWNSVALSLPDNAFMLVTWDSEAYDVGNVHAAGASRFTIPAGAGGTYRVTVTLAYGASAIGQRITKVLKNSAEFPGNGYILGAATTGYITGMSLTVDLDLAAGDYVEAAAYQNSGGPLTLGGNASYIQNRIQISRIA